jgi:hypothetical protein
VTASEGGVLVFIVEMFWGRPHEIVILGDDGSGEMVPIGTKPTGNPLDPERRTFLLHDQPWRVFQAIAREYGWRPAGTVSCAEWNGDQADEPSYEPHSWRCKQVTAEDAAAWAAALERALPVLVTSESRATPPTIVPALGSEGMLQALRGPSAPLAREFIAFLRRGAFKFLWDD